jgi:hypothetical protein
MIIKIPDNFTAERKYIIDTVFSDFFGLDFQIEKSAGQNYEIILDNKNELIVEDHFFSKIEVNNSYLTIKNLPQKIIFTKNQFITENDIPVIYGDEKIIMDQNKIICGIDIFSSSFFMLTRWEEYVNNEKDVYNRFLAKYSVAHKNNFLCRPVVNEYVEMLWNMLLFLKINIDRKKLNYQLVLTHDVDQPYWSQRNIFKKVCKDLLTKKNINYITNSIDVYIKSKKNIELDPYNNYDYLMDLSEKNNVKSHFFFTSANKSKFDIGYKINSNIIKNLIKHIEERDHIVGFHPGYYSYNNEEIWKKEFEFLNNHVKTPLKCGRQHYLRFEVPLTWQFWENNNFEWESSMTYSDKEGFRCGTCYEFNVFNILTGKKLSLKEKPLIVMEGSFFQYQNISHNEIINKVITLKEIVKKYKGNFILLWHNSSFNIEGYENNKIIYEEVLR